MTVIHINLKRGLALVELDACPAAAMKRTRALASSFFRAVIRAWRAACHDVGRSRGEFGLLGLVRLVSVRLRVRRLGDSPVMGNPRSRSCSASDV